MNITFLQDQMVNYNINKNNYFFYNNILIPFNLHLFILIFYLLRAIKVNES